MHAVGLGSLSHFFSFGKNNLRLTQLVKEQPQASNGQSCKAQKEDGEYAGRRNMKSRRRMHGFLHTVCLE